jgi:hypothetical protein
VTDNHGDQLTVKAAGSSTASQYTVDGDATISRGGQPAKLDAVKKGDSVALTVDGTTNHVRVISATAPPVGIAGRIAGLWWLIPLAALVPVVILLKGRVGTEPFVVKRVVPA